MTAEPSADQSNRESDGKPREQEQWSPPPDVTRIDQSPGGDSIRSLGSGEIVGRYTLIEPVGSGGMGIVYKALRDDGLPVAVKFQKSRGLVGDGWEKRLLKEFRCLSEVQHPNLIHLLDLVDYQGQPLLVTEFVEGGDLTRHIDTHGPMPLEQALPFFLPLLDGLSAMHDAGMVHRDIKPSNILLERDPETGEIQRPIICDFGLSRRVQQNESMQLTLPGAVVGTPMFMAPEQLLESSNPDTRSDVYALAATFFYCITGKPPVYCATISELRKLLSDSAYQFPDVDPLPDSPALKTLFAIALHRRPESRFQSAGWLKKEFEAFASGRPSGLVTIKPLPPKDDQTRTMSFQWDMRSRAADLWHDVSNTHQVNRMIGLPAPDFEKDPSFPGRYQATVNSPIGLLKWIENPFQWAVGHSHQVFREFENGPYQWIESKVELQEADDGCRLIHSFHYRPRTYMAEHLIGWQLRLQIYPKLNRLYRHLDHCHCGVEDHPIQSVSQLPFTTVSDQARYRRTLIGHRDAWLQHSRDAAVVDHLIETLIATDRSELESLRPAEVATRAKLPLEQVFPALLAASAAGILELRWAVICPICRVSMGSRDHLQEVDSHLNCSFCGIDRAVDFSSNIEILFRLQGVERSLDRPYCVGGPFHLPHVAAQQLIPAGHTRQFSLNLNPDDYRIQGPQLTRTLNFTVGRQPGPQYLEWDVSTRPSGSSDLSLAGPTQVFVLTNSSQEDVLIRIERRVSDVKRMTLLRALDFPEFARWFPDQVATAEALWLSTWRVVVATRPNDASEHDRRIRQARDISIKVREMGGQLLRFDDRKGCIWGFDDFATAIRFLTTLGQQDCDPIRFAMSAGEILTLILQDRLVYSGEPLNQVVEMLPAVDPVSHAGCIQLSQGDLEQDPRLTDLLEQLSETFQLPMDRDASSERQTTIHFRRR